MKDFPWKILLTVYLIITFLVVSIAYCTDSYNSNFFDGVLVEAHGVLIEFLVFAFIIGLIEYRREKDIYKSQLITQLKIISGPDKSKQEATIRYIVEELNALKITNFNFKYSQLNGVNFSGLNFSKSDFSHAQLDNSDFSNSTLINANLKHASMKMSSLQEADIKKANFIDTTIDASEIIKARNFESAITNSALSADIQMALEK